MTIEKDPQNYCRLVYVSRSHVRQLLTERPSLLQVCIKATMEGVLQSCGKGSRDARHGFSLLHAPESTPKNSVS